MTEIFAHKQIPVSSVVPPLFSQETLDSLHALGTVYAKIHRRLIAEGYTIKDGIITKPNLNKIMTDIIIEKGEIFGKGVYANKDFKKGQIVIQYHLKKLSGDEFKNLSEEEKCFVHTHYGVNYLYSIPERYVNHSSNPNTLQDLKKQCDIATRDIKKGEQITTDSSKDNI